MKLLKKEKCMNLDIAIIRKRLFNENDMVS